jgi:tRNAThr (cytosine32-N3)-methyltransferase
MIALSIQQGRYSDSLCDDTEMIYFLFFAWSFFQHQTNFFKDRHYLSKAFPEEFGVLYAATKETKNDTQQSIQPQLESQPQPQPKPQQIISLDSDTIANDFTIVEIGCGVGNTLLPLLELEPFFTYYTSTCNDMIQKTRRISIWGLDFSQVAIELLRQDARYIQASQQKRAMSAVWDITKSNPREIHPSLESGSDISLLLFCLSAISPDKMPQAAKNVADTLKPGGTLLIRDYGRYDEAQLKLGRSRGKCISENFYVKHDSTRVYYFELEDLDRLFGPSSAGLICIEKKYIQRVYRNRSDGTERRRVWVQARYRKPQHS